MSCCLLQQPFEFKTLNKNHNNYLITFSPLKPTLLLPRTKKREVFVRTEGGGSGKAALQMQRGGAAGMQTQTSLGSSVGCGALLLVPDPHSWGPDRRRIVLPRPEAAEAKFHSHPGISMDRLSTGMAKFCCITPENSFLDNIQWCWSE